MSEIAIQAQGLTVQFPAGGGETVTAINDLSLEVRTGTVFCLLGPNGSGKTTVVNVLNGLLAPSEGRAAVLGLHPQRDRKELLSRIALAPQETALYEQLTGRENLRFHAEYYGVDRGSQSRRIDQVLALVSLQGTADSRVRSYSGGMRRRLMLGRALLTEPELIFFDEPTLGVDVQSRHAIWERIDAVADEGRTVFLSTNYMEEADHLGREVMIIDDGRAVAGGPPSQLRRAVAPARLELGFETVEAAAAAADRLGRHHAVRRSARTLTLDVKSGRTDAVDVVPGVLDELDGPEGRPASVTLAEPSLQDAFLHHTGHSLRD